MSDVILIFESKKSRDVGLLFGESSCCNSAPVDLAQQVQIEKNRKDILNLTNNIALQTERLETRIRERIIAGSTLTEDQSIGDYYILQEDTIRKVTRQKVIQIQKKTKGENETCLNLTRRQ